MDLKSAKKAADKVLFAANAEPYTVPGYTPRGGKSVDKVARELGGVVPLRSQRALAEHERRVIAVVYDAGLTFPVVKA